MELEQAEKEWNNAKQTVIVYFKNKGITIEYDETIYNAKASNENGEICFCYLNDEDIIVKILYVMPELNSSVLNYLLDKLDNAYKNYLKIALYEQKEM